MVFSLIEPKLRPMSHQYIHLLGLAALLYSAELYTAQTGSFNSLSEKDKIMAYFLLHARLKVSAARLFTETACPNALQG